jgi:hypothetical protein
VSVRRFRILFDDEGEEIFCLAFDTAQERDAALRGDAPEVQSVPPEIEPARPRGRPSFDSVIARAVAALQLDPAQPLAARSRLVLRHLAERCTDPSEIPGRRTVETFLAGQTRKNSRSKSRRKSARAKVTATGG